MTITLTPEQYDAVRLAARDVQDATRAAELAAAKAKVAVGEALARQTAVLRALAEHYPDFDPDQPLTLGRDRTLTTGAVS